MQFNHKEEEFYNWLRGRFDINLADASIIAQYISEMKLANAAGYIEPISDWKAERTKLGLTLREVEEKTGISNAYLSQLENGKIKRPSFEMMQKLSTLYRPIVR